MSESAPTADYVRPEAPPEPLFRCLRCGVWRDMRTAIFLDVTTFGDSEHRYVCGGCAHARIDGDECAS